MLSGSRQLRTDYPGAASSGTRIAVASTRLVSFWGGALLAWDTDGEPVYASSAAPGQRFLGVVLEDVVRSSLFTALRRAAVWLPVYGAAVSPGDLVQARDNEFVESAAGGCVVGRVVEMTGGEALVDTSDRAADAEELSLEEEAAADSVTLTAHPSGEHVTIAAAGGGRAGVLTAADKARLDAVRTTDLASESELASLEAVVLTSTRVWGPTLLTLPTSGAAYLGDLTVPALAWRLASQETQEGQRTPQTIPAGAVAALRPLADAQVLGALAPDQRWELPRFVDGDTELYVGRTESDRLVVQAAGATVFERVLSVTELEPHRLTTNADIRAAAGALVAGAAWPDGGGATYDPAAEQLTIRVPAGAGGNSTALTVGAARPAQPSNGDLWSDTVDGALKRWDGAGWRPLGVPSRGQVYALATSILQAGAHVRIAPDAAAQTLTLEVTSPPGLSQAEVDARITALVAGFALPASDTPIGPADLAAAQRLPAAAPGQWLRWAAGGRLENAPSPDGLSAAQRTALDDAVQISGAALTAGVLHLRSADGSTKDLTVPRLTVRAQGVLQGTEETVTELDFSGLAVTRTGNRVSISGAGTLAALAAAPPAANHGLGDVADVGGKLQVLREDDAADISGTAGAVDAHYLGVSRLPHVTAVGKWSDASILAEYEFVRGGVENRPLHRVRLPKSLFGPAPPTALYFRGVVGSRYHISADWTGGRDGARDTASAWAWASGATGERFDNPQPGDDVRLFAFTDPALTLGLVLVSARHWAPYQATPPRPDSRVSELARAAAGGALARGAGDVEFVVHAATIDARLKDSAVTPPKLDAGDAAKRKLLRDRLEAEATLRAGTGVTFSAPDADGRRAVSVTDPRPRGTVGPDAAFAQAALDTSHAWRVEAIEHSAAHVATLRWDSSEDPPLYQGGVQVTPQYSANLQYFRVGGTDGGKFVLSTEPANSLTLGTLFPGKTVSRLVLRFGADLSAAEAAAELEVPVVVNAGVRSGLSLISSAALARDPAALARAATVVATVDFEFTDGTRAYPGTHEFRTVDQAQLRQLAREQHVRALEFAGDELHATLVAADGTETTVRLTVPQAAPEVRTLPADPSPGERVTLTNPQTIAGFGVLVAAASDNGNFAGFSASGPALGSLEGAPANRVTALLSYADVADNHGSRNKTQLWTAYAADATAVPQAVWIAGTRYAAAATAQHGIYDLTGAAGTLLTAGAQVQVAVQWTDGSYAWPRRTYRAGDWTWNGVEWIISPASRVTPQNLLLAAAQAIAAGKLVSVDQDTGKFGLTAPYDPVAAAGSAAVWPAAKQAHLVTQAQYDALVAAGTVDAAAYYDVVG